MAFTMSLHGSAFDRKGWLENVLSSYFDDPTSVNTPLSPLCLQWVEFDGSLGDRDLWLHPEAGIRGVTVRENGDGIEVSLPSGSSRADFELAWDLMRMGVSHGASASDEEQTPLDFSANQISAITTRQSDFYWATLAHQVKESESVILPVAGQLHLTVTPEEAANGPEALEQSLVDRMSRYSDVFVASIMEISNGGAVQLLSNYGHMPSLISSEVELIMARGEIGDVIGKPVPASHFYAVMAGRVENLGPWNYISGVDFDAEPGLLAALRADPAGNSIPKPAIDTREGLTGEDWAILAKAPCLVFLMVAAADGGVDKKEMTAFGIILKKHDAVPSPVFSKILQIASANIEPFVTELIASGAQTKQHLADLSKVLASGKLPQVEAATIATYLCGLGHAIASASGGFMGFGSKISKKEKEVLDFLEIVLGSAARGDTSVLALLGLLDS